MFLINKNLASIVFLISSSKGGLTELYPTKPRPVSNNCTVVLNQC